MTAPTSYNARRALETALSASLRRVTGRIATLALRLADEPSDEPTRYRGCLHNGTVDGWSRCGACGQRGLDCPASRLESVRRACAAIFGES